MEGDREAGRKHTKVMDGGCGEDPQAVLVHSGTLNAEDLGGMDARELAESSLTAPL